VPELADSPVWAGIEDAAVRFAEHTALVDTDDRRLTFAQFRDASLRVAAGLADLGIRAGSRVSWHLPTGLESVVVMGALARLGAVQNPLIMTFREAELTSIDEQFAPEFVVTANIFRGFDHRAMIEKAFGHRATIVVSDRAALTDSAAPEAVLALPSGDPSSLGAAVDGPVERWIYVTSGSTAAPKAVRHTDASIWASSNSMAEEMPLSPADLISIAFPMSHIGGVACWITSLRTGMGMHLVDVFDPITSPLEMARAGATILGSATPFFDAYLLAQQAHGPEKLFPRLHWCMGGGAPLARSFVGRLVGELGGEGVLNGYGLTECPIAGNPPLVDPHGFQLSASWLPARDVRVRTLDAQGKPVGIGEEGELTLSAPQLFAGYLDPALDADAFDDEGFFRTGDLATIGVHGEVKITGRLKEVVIRNGENISLPEVEAALIVHPAIHDIAVVGLPDERRGERCCAAIVVESGATPPTIDDLLQVCRAAGLAAYKTPEQIELLDAIPRNSMGKIQRNAVRDEILRATA
jgi:cyclohexanecarboxylate-CoA ligase